MIVSLFTQIHWPKACVPSISIPTIFLWAPVQALKVESLQEKQAMSDFPQV